MEQLALVQGDLVLSAGNFLRYSGTDKIRQDLDIALNEAYGSDVNHPYWGTILDRYIGQPLTQGQQAAVSAEVQRVLKNYITTQADAVSVAPTYGTKSNFDTNDVVRGVESIDVKASYDSVLVTIVLQTIGMQSITVTRQVLA